MPMGSQPVLPKCPSGPSPQTGTGKRGEPMFERLPVLPSQEPGGQPSQTAEGAAKPAPAEGEKGPARPGEAKPEEIKPEAAKPEAAKPEESKPEAAKPEAARPEAAKPEAAKPETPGVPGPETPPAHLSPSTGAAEAAGAAAAPTAEAHPLRHPARGQPRRRPSGRGGVRSGCATSGPGFGGGLAADANAPPMIGDQSPFGFHASPAASAPGFPPPVPGPRAGALFYPSIRSFKIAENMSPQPQDRFFFNFNYYNNVNDTVDTRNGSPIDHIKAYRYFFGFEKTFNEGKGSLGLRLPLDNVTADSPNKLISTPTSTALGDLTIFGKYILEQNKQTGSMASIGLAVTPPTGTSKFAGAPYLFGIRSVYIQPFFGYIYNVGNWYIQGFCAFDFPSNYNDVTLMYNDVGIGYYLIRSNDPNSFLTTLAPTFEVHVNTPFNHRDPFNKLDIAGTPDVVDLTFGVNFQFRRRSILTAAFITPVTSPQPFNTEASLLFNFYYGPLRNVPPVTPPPTL